jgi:Tol biopolymer transport system component
VWIWDLTRSTERRLTTDPAFELDPFWSPAADRIVFASNRVGGIFNLDEQAVTGTGRQESLLAGATRKAPTQWTRDGKLIFYTATDPKTREDIWALPIENGKPGTPTVFLHSEFEERHAQLSPVGNWLAYTSNESGKDEVYVRAFPSAEESKRISTAGGQEPRWRSDGGELYFLSTDGKMMAVPIKIGTGPKPSIEAGSPKVLFPTPPLAYYIQTGFAYDVTPDGKRFLLTAVADGTGSSTNLDLVANWNQNAP